MALKKTIEGEFPFTSFGQKYLMPHSYCWVLGADTQKGNVKEVSVRFYDLVDNVIPEKVEGETVIPAHVDGLKKGNWSKTFNLGQVEYSSVAPDNLIKLHEFVLSKTGIPFEIVNL